MDGIPDAKNWCHVTVGVYCNSAKYEHFFVEYFNKLNVKKFQDSKLL
jgi:hypothetical protein